MTVSSSMTMTDLKTALKWLAGAWDSQCIIFTCHQREEAILKSEGIEHHLIQI